MNRNDIENYYRLQAFCQVRRFWFRARKSRLFGL